MTRFSIELFENVRNHVTGQDETHSLVEWVFGSVVGKLEVSKQFFCRATLIIIILGPASARGSGDTHDQVQSRAQQVGRCQYTGSMVMMTD